MKPLFKQSQWKEKETSALPQTKGEYIRASLLADIDKTKCALEVAYAGFDDATDPDLIDCYIYEVNSALKRYRFLLNQAALLLPELDSYVKEPDFLSSLNQVTSV